MSNPKFINELNQKVNIFAEIDGSPKQGVGPGGKSEVTAADRSSDLDELEFVDYDIKKEVKIIIEVDKLPNNSKGEGIKYAFGERMGRAPHHIEVQRKGNDFTLIVHYMESGALVDVDPAIKHPN